MPASLTTHWLPSKRRSSLPPQRAVPCYDAAATLFQLGRYAEARQRYRRGPQARRQLPADQDRLCPGQYGTGPGRHTRGDRVLRRMSRLDRAWQGPGRCPPRRRRSTASSHSSNPSPPPFLKARAPAISRSRSGRTVVEIPIETLTTAIRPMVSPRAGQGGGGNSESDAAADGANNRPIHEASPDRRSRWWTIDGRREPAETLPMTVSTPHSRTFRRSKPAPSRRSASRDRQRRP